MIIEQWILFYTLSAVSLCIGLSLARLANMQCHSCIVVEHCYSSMFLSQACSHMCMEVHQRMSALVGDFWSSAVLHCSYVMYGMAGSSQPQ